MHTTVIGLFDTYGQAEAAVRDLEIAGIVGEEVEVISDTDRDARAEALGVKPRESFRDRIARVFGGSAKPAADEVYDTPGDMPNYIGEQEYYASHVRQGRSVVIVRAANELAADQATAILREHGGKIAERRRHDDRPETEAPRSAAETASGIGDEPATTGGDAQDLEAKGKQFRVRGQ